LHNLRPGTSYPATLVLASDRDERVAPAHSFKFTAALQAAQAAPAPCLIRVESQAGHGAGTPTGKLLDASADTLAFLVETMSRNP
jgi:prolyl oligopeptidase